MRRPRADRILFSLFLLVLTPAVLAAAPAPGPRANARALVRMAGDACARTARAAQGKLDRRDPRYAAFWMSLDRMQISLSDVGDTLRQRELSFFRAMRSGSVALAQLGVVWQRSGVRDPAVDEGVRTLTAAYRQVRNRFGPEWVRFQSGKPLSEEERRRFERMRAEQARLAGKLGSLRDGAAARGDRVTADQLALLIVQAQSIATAPLTLDEMLEASVLSDTIRGEWYGTRAVHPTAQEDWVEADEVVEEIYTDPSVGFVFTGDLSTVQSWSYTEKEVELPEEVAVAEEPLEQPSGILVLEEDAGEAFLEPAPAPEEEPEPAAEIEVWIDGEPVQAQDEEAIPEETTAEDEGEEEADEDLPQEEIQAVPGEEDIVVPEQSLEEAEICTEEGAEEGKICADPEEAAAPAAPPPAPKSP